MRLLIVLDTITPGISGVADYALQLGQAVQSTTDLEVIFHPLGQNNRSRAHDLLQRIREVQPDWVSYHFVPYAYATRGYVTGMTLPWPDLRGLVGTHIYFHEVWIGAHQGASLRHRLSGSLQRRGIRQLILNLRPNVVHTSNHLYSAMLHKEGIPNSILPLFSTIPITCDLSDPYPSLLDSLSPGMARDECVVVLFFGAIYPCIDLLPATQWLYERCSCHAKQLIVLSLGHSPSANDVFNYLRAQFPVDRSPFFVVKGKMNAASLSSWFSYADGGIATTPYNIVAKSASAASLAEHGLPVLVIDAGLPVRGLPNNLCDLAPDFWLFGDSRLENFPFLPPRRTHTPLIQRVVNQFVDDLKIDSR